MPPASLRAPLDPVQALYREHHGWLLALLRRRLRCPDGAADLAHDTFVRVLLRPEVLPGLREPRAYLTTIARNLLINHVRHRALESAWLDALAQLPTPLAPSPEEHLLVLEALREIDAMLDGLPARAREAFLLAQLDGLTYAEVAARLGVSERTVKRYMAEAFARCILLAAP
jgi:RNA polymerase sigma-70 factor (ECF subfamily)